MFDRDNKVRVWTKYPNEEIEKEEVGSKIPEDEVIEVKKIRFKRY